MPRKVKLALQGGGAKITSILAAMEAVEKLEENGEIEVTEIAGTSAGAIIAVLYAGRFLKGKKKQYTLEAIRT